MFGAPPSLEERQERLARFVRETTESFCLERVDAGGFAFLEARESQIELLQCQIARVENRQASEGRIRVYAANGLRERCGERNGCDEDVVGRQMPLHVSEPGTINSPFNYFKLLTQ